MTDDGLNRVDRRAFLAGLAASAAALCAQLRPPTQDGVALGHLHLLVADPEAHKKLWIEMLGATETHTGSLELLRLPGIYIIVGKARTSPSEGTVGSTVNHFGFAVKSYAEMKAKITTAGLPVVQDNAETKQIMVDFPEKVRVEFTEVAGLETPVAMHHIHLSTTDPEKLQSWYVKTFGAKSGKRGNFLAAFLPGGEVDMRKAQQAEAPTKGRSLDHIGFEIQNLQEFCKKLEASGIKLDVPYREVAELGGLKLAFLTDPEGTRIELTEGLAGK